MSHDEEQAEENRVKKSGGAGEKPPVKEIFVRSDEHNRPAPIRDFEDLPWDGRKPSRSPSLLKRLFRN